VGPGRLVAALDAWYAEHARDLPWRRPEATAWGVVVSEFMLQQTPVARVLPVWARWLERWPTPAALAAEPPGEAIRAWGRLGYPRRALRLHAAATEMVARHAGHVPTESQDLRALPGVGDYTAAAVAAFAHRQRTVVLDTNVRRVLGRLLRGDPRPRATGPTVAERAASAAILPSDPEAAAAWSVALMELGALVCTARSPRCGACPLQDSCRWYAAGWPGSDTASGRRQAYAGTDRQARGRLLAAIRDCHVSITRGRLETAWDQPGQRERALASLLADGLVVAVGDDSYALPGPATDGHAVRCR